jgi:hypothetical protein
MIIKTDEKGQEGWDGWKGWMWDDMKKKRRKATEEIVRLTPFIRLEPINKHGQIRCYTLQRRQG